MSQKQQPNPVITSSVTASVEINGTQIHYQVAGQKADLDADQNDWLLLIHAGIADSRMWDAQFDAFAEQYRTIRFDMRGFGQSPMVAGDFSHREDIVALLHHLGAVQVHLVGASMGGTNAIEIALEHPELVKSLTTIGSSPRGFQFDGPPAPQYELMDAPWDKGDFTTVSELEVQIWVDGPYRKPDEVNPAIRDLVRDMNEIALRNEAQELGEEIEPDYKSVDRLAEITVPTLVLYGDLDNQAKPLAAQLMAEQIPQAELAVIKGTAHLPNMEKPAELQKLVLDFLAKNS